MATQWFSNRGQKIQTGIAAAALLLAAYINWPAFKAFDLSSLGAILFYLLFALLLIAIARLISTIRVRRPLDSNATAPAKKVGEGQRKFRIPSIDFPTPNWLEPLAPVVNQKYINETVALDGKSFQHCEFHDVTFLYNGTKPTQFIGCKMTGKPGFSFMSDNPLVLGVIQIVQMFKTALGEKADVEWNLFDGSSR
jgi:hypothetical protein